MLPSAHPAHCRLLSKYHTLKGHQGYTVDAGLAEAGILLAGEALKGEFDTVIRLLPSMQADQGSIPRTTYGSQSGP